MLNFVEKGDALQNQSATDPAAPKSGDPVRVGTIVGVAAVDAGDGGNDASNTTVVTVGVFNLSVKGIDGAGNSAVAIGDKIYYVDADTPKLSKKDTGALFGKALGAVGAGATATIPVLLIQA